MKSIKKFLAIFSVAVATQSAHAAVIPTVNGFVPLQYTKNLSIQDFYAGVGGWNQNYHLATHGEISSLLSGYGISPHQASPFTRNEYDFIYYVGGYTLGPYGTYFSDGAQGVIGRSTDDYVRVVISNGESAMPYQNCPAFNECTSPTVEYAHQSFTYKDNSSGLFLVAGIDSPILVPEPVSLSLFAVGFGTLLLRRRKS